MSPRIAGDATRRLLGAQGTVRLCSVRPGRRFRLNGLLSPYRVPIAAARSSRLVMDEEALA
jgi:hypothetical protein